MTSRRVGIAGLLTIYIGSVVLANWLTSRYGQLWIAPGLKATAGTAVIGAAIMSRDFLQDALGRWRIAIVGAIGVGAGLSWLLASHQIAAASGITFAVAELLEYALYTLRRRYAWGTGRWAAAVWLANGTSAVADTFLFLWLAGFGLTVSGVGGQLLGKAYVTVAVIAVAVFVRNRRPVRA